MMASSFAKALGIKQSKTGAAIGGAIGSFVPIPGGAAIGGLIGGTIGGLFKKTKQGGATISATDGVLGTRSEEHTSELQSLMRISYAVFCLKKKKQTLPSIKINYTKATVTKHN